MMTVDKSPKVRKYKSNIASMVKGRISNIENSNAGKFGPNEVEKIKNWEERKRKGKKRNPYRRDREEWDTRIV